MKKGLIATLGVAVLLLAVLVGTTGASGDDSIEVVAYFDDASPLTSGNVVKAAGVDVGTVDSIKIDDGRAKVTLKLDRAVLPLHKDVTATITNQDLLGERFVKLERGSDDQPELSEPMIIPEKQTSRVVDLQDVLNSVDTPTAEGLSALLTESGEALRGHGKKADKALAALAPALRQADDLAAILRDQNKLLGRLVDTASPVASALATKDGKAMNQLVESSTRLLEGIAAERAALQTSLAELPSTLSSARQTLAELVGTAGPATRTLRKLRPVTDDLPEISKELTRFANAADPALASLPPVLKEADRLLEQAAPVVNQLRPAGNGLVSTARSADELTDDALSGKSLVDLMEFAKGWSLATSDYDAISHYFKAMIPLSPNAVGDDLNALVPALPDDVLHNLPIPSAPDLHLPGREDDRSQQGDGGKQSKRGAKADEGTDSTPQQGNLGTLLEGLLGGQRSQSATGLSAEQEQNLLQQILGGSR